ncbi:MAG: MBL fold metallo-hydrolase [Erythrobacter sp.]|jgi:metallo-beta-lactamase class B
MSAKLLPLLALAACLAAPASAGNDARPATASSEWIARCTDWDDWDKPGPPFRILGDTFYVGTCGIASILVVSADGLTLIDSGTDEGAKAVLANIRALGFDPRAVSSILMSHEHFDHAGGMARLQAATGATIYASPAAAGVLRSGVTGADDPQALSGHPAFPPVTGKIIGIESEDPIWLGGILFRPLMTPGHSPGAMSWQWDMCKGDSCNTVSYVDSLSPIGADEYRFSDHPTYLAQFRNSLARIAALDRCLLLTPHPSASTMRDRLNGSGLGANGRHDCRDYAQAIGKRLDQRLADEAGR